MTNEFDSKSIQNIRSFHASGSPIVARVNIGLNAGAANDEADAVAEAFIRELQGWKLDNIISVTRSEKAGLPRLSPVVDVTLPGMDNVTYVLVKPEMAAKIVEEHIVRGQPVWEYTLDALTESLEETQAI